ncbi:hypothetical protein P879_02069 [Paragonimus westermani]|uniref:Uncharacterized protein n=1 Tax=Paragonimus westermani TaxID=34504 RepID=A0A8T0DQI1_9TREM|nr:hypothetical protein P879_02069 [Paragonimus westermani]
MEPELCTSQVPIQASTIYGTSPHSLTRICASTSRRYSNCLVKNLLRHLPFVSSNSGARVILQIDNHLVKLLRGTQKIGDQLFMS